MSKFKAGQTYKTRNGAIARIYATDGLKDCEIHGATNSLENRWDAMTWDAHGRYISDSDSSGWDLIPNVQYWYMLVYVEHSVKKECSLLFPSEESRQKWIDKQPVNKILKTFEVEKP